MTNSPSPVELSVIIPVLNEAPLIPELFATLSGQRGCRFELVLCDGTSTDRTRDEAEQLARTAPFPVQFVSSKPGRGKQMNAGAHAARGETLLFLHADSHFIATAALANAYQHFASTTARGDGRLAGHFRLRFLRQEKGPSAAYYFYEWKARLGRPGCTHGDQGMMISRGFFRERGGFDESMPLMEDVRFAEQLDKVGTWLLLPDEIWTSARRFEIEGLRERQTLNAIVMNFASIGRDPLLEEIPRLYRNQDRTRPLQLSSLLGRIQKTIAALPRGERLSLWYETGRFVRENAWQLAFARDARRHFRLGTPVGEGTTPTLDLYDRHLDRLTRNPPGRLAAGFLTWIWFRLTLLHAAMKDRAGR